MSYIGNEPIVSATRTVTEITATAGQTVFTANGGYTVGYLDVFVNGSKLTNTDFTATNGTTVTLTEAAQAGDIVRLEALGTFLTSSAMSNVNPSYTGTLTGGTGVVNIGSGQIYKDASGNVGIGTSSPLSKLDVVGVGNYDGVVRVRSTGTNTPATVLGVDAVASAAGYVGTLNNLPFQIRTNDTERARIDSSGNLLVGTTSTQGWGRISTVVGSGANGLGVNQTDNANSWTCLYLNRSGSDGREIEFNRNGTFVGSVSVTGSATSYNTSSDYRLKENIAPMTGALAKVAQLKPVTYTWKSTGEESQGFIAHELAEVVPDAVTGEKDAVDADGNPVYQGIDTSFLVATLTAAIQEQQAIINDLKARIESLENK